MPGLLYEFADAAWQFWTVVIVLRRKERGIETLIVETDRFFDRHRRRRHLPAADL
jgi:hypothetical protein